MDKNANISNKLSFWQLLQQYAVEIPIIQRDYAQGRKNKKRLRHIFLTSLKNALTLKPLEMDFIYGEVKAGTFRPLDGQQRLTTLFLLHWYAAFKEDVNSPDYKKLESFTYQTRLSSQEFCRDLIGKGILREEGVKVSDTIRDSYWYSLSWKNDPTVAGMLTMLDDIDLHFSDEESLWNKLTDVSNPKISFIYIELLNLGLSDELYIKMNARGKQLSAFENLKASLEKKITENNWDTDKEDVVTFSIKADTAWTDLFWKNSEHLKFDSAFLNFMNNTTIDALALDAKDDVKRERILELIKDPKELNSDDFSHVVYDQLYTDLMTYSDFFTDFEMVDLDIGLPLWGHIQEPETLFSRIISNKTPTLKQRVLFYAQTRYLQRGTFDGGSFCDWIRVVRNIVQNATIDSMETLTGALHLMKELSEGALCIYDYLSQNNVSSNFASAQVNEEIRKANALKLQPDLKEIFNNLEDCDFCQGRISFALSCCGQQESELLDHKKLQYIYGVFTEYLDNGISDKVRSALFTVEDGKYYTYWSSYLYAVEAPKYRLLPNVDELRKFAYKSSHSHYLKRLVDQLINYTPLEIIESFVADGDTSNWKLRIITEPELLSFSQSKYIAVDDKNHICYLIPGSRVSNDEKGKNKLKEIS